MTDRDIKATALIVFRRHGRSASYYARSRADELRDQGATTGAEVWQRIATIVEEREREPKPGEAVN